RCERTVPPAGVAVSLSRAVARLPASRCARSRARDTVRMFVVRVGLVLSGGGARGAYEVGVLSWVLDELPQLLRRPVTFDVVTGTSVGAIHACYVTATQGTVRAGAALVDVWQQLEVTGVDELGLSAV